MILDCPHKCEFRDVLPPGVKAIEPIPVPRHAWGDVIVCPHGCGRAWLVRREKVNPQDGGKEAA